jgi:hypothetical protein
MESIDRLLAELKAEYQESQKAAELKRQSAMPAEQPSPEALVPSTQTIKTVNKTLDSGTFDSDLAQIKAEYEAQDKAQEVAKQELLKAEYEAQNKAQEVVKQEQLKPEPNKAQEIVKEQQFKPEYKEPNKAQEIVKQQQLKPEYKEPNKAQEIVKQEQPLAENVVQKQSHVQTHREKVRQAQVWLKNLNKNSDEGYWFDQFAFKYSSRIDAAIDYLQAVNEFD